MKIYSSQTIISLFSILILQSSLHAQLSLSEKVENDVMRLMQQGQIDESRRRDGLIATRDLLNQIPDNQNAKRTAAVLDLLADHQAIKDRPLVYVISSSTSDKHPDRQLQFDRALLLRISHLLKTFSPKTLGKKEARTLTQIASFIEEVEKRVATLPKKEQLELRESTNTIIKNLARIANNTKTEEKTAHNFVTTIQAMTAARDLVTQTSPLSPYLIPGLISGEIVEQNRKGLLHAGETLSYFPQVLQGDKEALKKMLKSAEGMKDALGKKKYGNSILNSLPSTLLEALPFFRYLGSWFGIPDPEQMIKFKRKGELWASTWGHFRFAGGAVVPVKRDFMERWQITLRLRYISGNKVTGQYEIKDPSIKESGTIVLHIAPEDKLPDGTPMRMSGWRYPDEPDKNRVKWSATRVK